MPKSHTPKEVSAIFIIADISGYTRFMIQHKEELYHAQVIISELLHALLREVKVPIKVAEIEGDAVFLYALKNHQTWDKDRARIGTVLEGLFAAFYGKIEQLMKVNNCKCGMCSKVQDLNLKIVVHSGDAILNRVGKFTKLSGVDTIIAHRLLKNSVDAKRYLMLTQTAFDDLWLPHADSYLPSEEHYDDVGTIPTRVHKMSDEEYVEATTIGNSMAGTAGTFARTYLKLIPLYLGLQKPKNVSPDA